MTQPFDSPEAVMRHALRLAERGLGRVEPNPPVGAVIVDSDLRLIAEGCHEQFGGPHAEINAITRAGERCRDASLYVTLEPCAHQGKTPPCTPAVIEAGFREVVAAVQDPADHGRGGGLDALRQAGLAVRTGVLEDDARRLIAPFTKLTMRGLPYVHAKWALSLDGRIATRTGDSRWISSEASRALVHELRGRMDAILVGIGTVLADDPLLTARPPGPRTAARIVLDSHARLPRESRLVATAADAPVIDVVLPDADETVCRRLIQAGVEVLHVSPAADRDAPRPDLLTLLKECGRRQMTNILVEGGSHVLGSFFDQRLVDECHVFVAPKVIGGAAAPAAVAGRGIERMAEAPALQNVQLTPLGHDAYLRGVLPTPD